MAGYGPLIISACSWNWILRSNLMFDHFGFLAPFYDKLIQPKDPQEIREFGHLPTTGWLLDAGGGTGRIAQALRGQAGMIVVADLSYQMLAQARSKDGLRLACGHSECLPFPRTSF